MKIILSATPITVIGLKEKKTSFYSNKYYNTNERAFSSLTQNFIFKNQAIFQFGLVLRIHSFQFFVLELVTVCSMMEKTFIFNLFLKTSRAIIWINHKILNTCPDISTLNYVTMCLNLTAFTRDQCLFQRQLQEGIEHIENSAQTPTQTLSDGCQLTLIASRSD